MGDVIFVVHLRKMKKTQRVEPFDVMLDGLTGSVFGSPVRPKRTPVLHFFVGDAS